MVGLIAHVDTSPDAPGAGVEPIVHRGYDGGRDRAAARRHGARPRRDARARRARPATTSSPRAATRCWAPTTRPAWRRSWPRSRTWPRTRSCRARRCASASRPTRRSARGPRCSTSSASARAAPTRSTARRSASCRTRRSRRTEAIVTIDGRRRAPGLRHRQARQRRAAGRPDARRAAAGPLTPETTAGPRGLHPRLRGQRDGGRARRSARSCATSTTTLLERTSSCSGGRPRRSWPTEPRARLEFEVARQYPNMRRHLEAVPRDRRERPSAAIRAEGIEPIRTPIRGGTDGSLLSAHGPADAEHLRRRPRVPLGARVGVGAGHGRRRRVVVRLAEEWSRIS